MDCFIKYCYDVGLREPTAKKYQPKSNNFLLGCFVINLIQGDNILGLNLKSSTISNYVNAASQLYTERDHPNPFTFKELKINYPKIIITALSKYEKVPDRKEVITDSMFEYIEELASQSDEDSLISSFKDWLTWSRYSGPRRGEWCQKRQKKYEIAEHGNGNEARAITARDVQFYTKHAREISLDDDFSNVAYAAVEWRFQKNHDNGEIIKYYVNPRSTKWCPALALWRIKQRAKRLGIPKHEPIAKYLSTNGKCLFITDYDVKTILQQAAREKLGIKCTKALSRWTSHSLQVTAANELHRLGFNTLFIQQRLRWRSDAFMKYLRHTIHVARKHSAMMSLNSENLKVRPSNLDTINKRIESMDIFRVPCEDDILWESNFYAAEAA